MCMFNFAVCTQVELVRGKVSVGFQDSVMDEVHDLKSEFAKRVREGAIFSSSFVDTDMREMLLSSSRTSSISNFLFLVARHLNLAGFVFMQRLEKKPVLSVVWR